MPRYQVLVTRDCTESATVEIEASSPEEAGDKAIRYAYGNPNVEWAADDGSGSDWPYLGDEDEAIEEIT